MTNHYENDPVYDSSGDNSEGRLSWQRQSLRERKPKTKKKESVIRNARKMKREIERKIERRGRQGM
jgi:hypothetical protein